MLNCVEVIFKLPVAGSATRGDSGSTRRNNTNTTGDLPAVQLLYNSCISR